MQVFLPSTTARRVLPKMMGYPGEVLPGRFLGIKKLAVSMETLEKDKLKEVLLLFCFVCILPLRISRCQ
jgi:hypothetical protein